MRHYFCSTTNTKLLNGSGFIPKNYDSPTVSLLNQTSPLCKGYGACDASIRGFG